MTASFFDRRLNGVAIYNPDLLSKHELVAQFVARRSVFEQIMSELARPGFDQHQLIIGHRGMGKTTLLRRIRYAVEDDPALANVWMPVTFPEEQYNVSQLSDFYVNCIDALSDALEHSGRRQEALALDAAVDELPARGEEKRAAEALAVLLRAADQLQKRLLLLVDNFDLIIERLARDNQAQWALRELLSRENRLLLIAASPVIIGATHTYEAPFYDFFQSRTLGGLTFDETTAVLTTLAGELKQPGVLDVVSNDPARIRTLHVLAGGNPRTIVLLFGVLAQGTEGDVRGDLERLLDQCTPLYKARFEAMPAQAQQVVDALAIHWDPASAGELAENLHLDVNSVSAQLNRLVQQDVVEKVEYDPETKTGFQIAERFFNIWYLMRASRRVRRRLIWLVEFLKLFYGMEQLLGRARELASSSSGADLRHVELCLAIAEAIPMHRAEQVALESRAVRALLASESLRHQMGDVLDLDGLDAPLKPIVDRQLRVEELERVVGSMRSKCPGNEQFHVLLSGAPITHERKLQLARTFDTEGEESQRKIVEELQRQHDMLIADFGVRLAGLLERAVREGYSETWHDVEGTRAAALTYAEPALAVVADASQFTDSELVEIYNQWQDGFVAEAVASRLVVIDKESAADIIRRAAARHPARPRLAALRAYSNIDGRDSEWIERELERLTANTEDAFLWLLRAFFYYDHSRWSDAAKVFKTVLKLKPDLWAHSVLALSLYQDQQYAEAEVTMRALLEHERSADHWHLLANICAAAEKYEEAADAARQGLCRDPQHHGLAKALVHALSQLKRFDDVVEPARMLAEDSQEDPETRALMLRAYAFSGDPERALVILAALVADDVLSDKKKKNLMQAMSILTIRGYGAQAMQCLESTGRVDEFRPLYEALRIHVSGKRLQLRRLAPELRELVTALLDLWGETADKAKPQPKRKRVRR